MASPLDGLDRYLLISSDTHAGAEPEAFGPYLEKKWESEYRAWVAEMDEFKALMRQVMGPRSIGVGGDPDLDGNRSWDSARRLREMEADGSVAEVIFSNTSPPFAPRPISEFGEPSMGHDHEKRWAGLKAYNRWLADFCAEAPGRRAGVAQIFLPFVEESVEEIRWAQQAGLTGGVLLPGAPPGSGIAPLYAPEYEPIWSVCEELGMPINHHAGGATPDFGNYLPNSMAMYMLEVMWWTHRALWHLMFSGVFERHPNLHFCLTEVGAGWKLETLRHLDAFFNQMKYEKHTSEHIFGGPTVKNLSLTPSEYFARQCHIGASFLAPRDCERRHEIGIDQIMWGSDYPHIEGSYPYTREHLRLTFQGVDPDEIQRMVGLNAAEVYGFDIGALAPLAAEFGPTKAEIAQPIALEDIPEEARKCPGFSRDNQRAAAA